MSVVNAVGRKGIEDCYIVLKLHREAKELLNKMIGRKGANDIRRSRMIRIKLSMPLKYTKLYETANIGRMREANFDFLMIQEMSDNKIHFHVFDGAGGPGSKNNNRNKIAPVDFFINDKGEVFLANTQDRYTAREANSILNADSFFSEMLEELKNCGNNKNIFCF